MAGWFTVCECAILVLVINNKMDSTEMIISNAVLFITAPILFGQLKKVAYLCLCYVSGSDLILAKSLTSI